MRVRCPTCPAVNNCLTGSGPVPSDYLFIGEAPGEEENKDGIEFIGRSGKEFNGNYLNLAGLYRPQVRVRNVVCCRPGLNRKPTPTEVIGCASHFLPDELDRVNPQVIFLMGATACSLLPLLGFGNKIDLESEHGIPRRGWMWNWRGWIVPLYHPAGGLHNTSMMIPMLEDWERLRPWILDDEWMWPVDEQVRDYGLIETVVEAEEFFHRCSKLDEPWLIGGDTESHGGEDYSWQLSLEDGVARMVMLKNRKVCDETAKWLIMQFSQKRVLGPTPSKWTPRFVFHYAQADLPIFESELGYSLHGLYRDTNQEAYHLGNLPQGLKGLARRLLGRKRKSWEETVTPASKDALSMWMMEGWGLMEAEWQGEVVKIETDRVSLKTGRALKDKVTRKITKSPAEKVLWDILKYTQDTEAHPDYDPWAKLTERLTGGWMERVTDVIGPPPVKGIAHVPSEEQIEYGCSDPDDTRRLAVLLDQLRREFIDGLDFQEEDRDA